VRIGLAGVGANIDAVVRQAERAEADGFTTLWYASPVLGDPLAAMALVARATSRIELGTSVLQTYACHPLLQAHRAANIAAALGDAGRLTLGVGPSHQMVVENMLGESYATPGRQTEEYVQVLAALLRGEQVGFTGEEFRVNAGPIALPEGAAVPVLVGALGPRLLRVAGQYAAGTITWMANAKAVESHVSPLIRKAAADAGRPSPRIVVGLPVAVHDDLEEARSAGTQQFGFYGSLPNYQRILAHGAVDDPAAAAIVGDEASVTAQLAALLDAGATDIWAAPFAVGDDKAASRGRTLDLLKSLLTT
jgi:F420-dependent oxidoreductase-like protein